jgi:antitoxin CcdA
MRESKNIVTDQDDAAIARDKKESRNRKWREENAVALAAYGEEVARDGLPLAQYRSF